MKNRTATIFTILALLLSGCREDLTESILERMDEIRSMRSVEKRELSGHHGGWQIQGSEQGSVFIKQLTLPTIFQHELVFDPEVVCDRDARDCDGFHTYQATIERSPMLIEIDHHTSTPDFRVRSGETSLPNPERKPAGWWEQELMVWSEDEDAVTLRPSLSPCSTSQAAFNVEVVELVRDEKTFVLELLRLRADFHCDDGSTASGVDYRLERYQGGD